MNWIRSRGRQGHTEWSVIRPSRRRVISGLGAMAGATVLGGCGGLTVDHRFRYTLEFEVDGRTVASSSVLEVYIYKHGGQPGYSAYVVGVTPIVDLGRHGMLIVHLNVPTHGPPSIIHHYGKSRPGTTYYSFIRDAKRTEFIEEKLGTWRWFPKDARLKDGICIENYDQFRARYDKRCEYVDSPDDITRIIGPGVRYVRSIIEPTSDRVITSLRDVPMKTRPKWMVELLEDEMALRSFENSDPSNSYTRSKR